MDDHAITIVEHGARSATLYVHCSCGWHHPKPIRHVSVARVIATHRNAHVAIL